MGPRIGKARPAGFAFSIHSFGIKKVSDSGGHRSLAERGPFVCRKHFRHTKVHLATVRRR
jgi:hypothetical protein